MASSFDIRQSLVDRGVYYGWFVVFACFLSALITFGIVYSFNVFLDHIVNEFNRSAGTISLIFSLQTFVSFGFAGIFGLWIDRYGPRELLFIAAILIAGGLGIVSQSQSFIAIVLVYGIIVAAGIGVAYVIAFATVPRWFSRRRGTATALAVSGSGIGIMVGPPVSNTFIGFVGWQDAYLILAGLALILLIVAALLVADSPESLGIDSSHEFVDIDPVTASNDEWRIQLQEIVRTVWNPAFGYLMLGFLFMYIPGYIILVHVVSHVTDVGIGREIGVFAASLIGAMNIVGKYLFGPITDRVGEIYAIMACATLISVGTMSYAFVSATVHVVVATFIFGLGYGGTAVLISPIVARFFGEINLNTLTGVVSIAFAVSGSVAPVLAGIGFDVFGSYRIPLIVGGGIGLLAVGCFKAAARTSDTVFSPASR